MNASTAAMGVGGNNPLTQLAPSNAGHFGGAMDSMDRVTVNFRPELSDMIRETKYLDRMGCMVPEAALNVALQEEKYINYIEAINDMLSHYHSQLYSLDPAEANLLQSHIVELKRVMKPGFTRLNWNSLGIPDFIARCNQVTLSLMNTEKVI
jgi:dynein heavy chain